MTDPRARFTRLVETAEALGVARRWEAAGRAWVEAARVAIDAGALPSAAQALDRAGEAFRRDDRLAEARRALLMAADLPASDGVMVAVRLAGIATELGDGADAIRRCRAVLGPGRALALDTLIGAILGFGRKAEARPLVEELSEPVAQGFRRGQLLRLDGDLAGARAAFDGVIAALAGRPGAESGVAAARTENAEIDALRGDTAAAVAAFEEGRALHEAAGRRALALRSEAGRVRAAVEGGLDAFPGVLREGLAYAAERGLVMLEADLRVALGMALGAADELRAAIRTAEARGARLLAGRARMQLALRTRCSPEQRRRWLLRAADELADHAILAGRARAEAGR